MLREIKSPAIKSDVPNDPYIHINNSCQAIESNLIDEVGNTYICSPEIEFWTDGISNTTINIGRSLINFTEFSLNIAFKPSSTALNKFIVFGSENGVWFETQNNTVRVRSNSGTFFSQSVSDYFSVGIVKNSLNLRFFVNGEFIQESNRPIQTENNTVINVGESDRFNHFVGYNRVLTDNEMRTLYYLNFKRSTGIDFLGYRNSSQAFEMRR